MISLKKCPLNKKEMLSESGYIFKNIIWGILVIAVLKSEVLLHTRVTSGFDNVGKVRPMYEGSIMELYIA